jgi:GT2 family glycosyltransferase
MSFKLSIVIPSRWNIENITNIFWCLKNQTFQDFNVYMIIDTPLDKQWYESLKSTIINQVGLNFQDFSKWAWTRDQKYNIICNINSDFGSETWDGASYVRNYWLNLATWEFINFFDDDIVFENNYLKQSLDYRTLFKTEIWKDLVLTPTLMYRKTGKIQNQWFKRYIFRQSRPQINFLKNQKSDFIQLYSWNSLFAPSSLFKQFQFDIDINFVAEDLDFTYTIHKAWYPILVLADLKVYHMEREKSLLDQAWVGNSISAYQKWRNRIIFVRKHWNILQKLLFFGFWLRANNLRLILKIFKLAKWKQKWNLIYSFLKWNFDGLFRY